MSETELQDMEQQENLETTETQETPSETPAEKPDTPSPSELLATYQQIATTAIEREERLNREIQDLRSRLNAPAPKPEEPLPNKEEDPIGYLEAVNERRMKALEERLEAQTRPLQEVVMTSRHQQAYADKAVEVSKKYPAMNADFFMNLYPQLGPKFDVNNLEIAALAAYGQMAASGKLPTAKKEDPPSDTPVTPSIPRTNSSLPPSTPPSNPAKLTEAQRSAMRSMGLKPENSKDVERFMTYISQDTRVYGAY